MGMREWIAQRLPADSRFGEGVRRIYRRLGPRTVRAWTEVLHGLAASSDHVRFVQVGANDSGYGDPLRYHILHNHWRGLLVEPLPYIYKRLKTRYPGIDGLQFANVAIDNQPGERSFYHLRPSDEPGLPVWYDMLGSFLKENVLNHQQFLADIPERIVETPVRCMTLDGACAEHGIDQFDVLHIDAEGYDYEILRTVDLTRYQVSLVLFEQKHLSKRDYLAALAQLHTAGFLTHTDEVDTVAVCQTALEQKSALKSAWHFLRERAGVDTKAQHSGTR